MDIKLPGPDDAAVLVAVAADVFDDEVGRRVTTQFLNDPRHHLVAAIDCGVVVGLHQLSTTFIRTNAGLKCGSTKSGLRQRKFRARSSIAAAVWQGPCCGASVTADRLT